MALFLRLTRGTGGYARCIGMKTDYGTNLGPPCSHGEIEGQIETCGQ